MKRKLLGVTALALIAGLGAASAQQRQYDEPRSRPEHPSSQPSQSQKPDSARPAETTGQGSGSAQQEPAPQQSQQSPQPAPQQGAQPQQGTQPRQGAQQQPSKQQQQQQPSAQQPAQQQPSQQTTQQPAQKSAPTASQPQTGQSTGQQQTGQASGGAASVTLDQQQQTRLSASIASLNVRPLSNVNFSIAVGTVAPRSVRLQPLPASVVAIVPQYRGYHFVVVREEIVIIEPRSYKIVAVLPYSGGKSAAVSQKKKFSFSEKQRGMIRSQISNRRTTTTTTTGASPATTTEIVVGERLPETVTIERFPDTVYREVPALRSYQYITRDRDIYVVDPRERRVIEIIE